MFIFIILGIIYELISDFILKTNLFIERISTFETENEDQNDKHVIISKYASFKHDFAVKPNQNLIYKIRFTKSIYTSSNLFL